MSGGTCHQAVPALAGTCRRRMSSQVTPRGAGSPAPLLAKRPLQPFPGKALSCAPLVGAPNTHGHWIQPRFRRYRQEGARSLGLPPRSPRTDVNAPPLPARAGPQVLDHRWPRGGPYHCLVMSNIMTTPLQFLYTSRNSASRASSDSAWGWEGIRRETALWGPHRRDPTSGRDQTVQSTKRTATLIWGKTRT